MPRRSTALLAFVLFSILAALSPRAAAARSTGDAALIARIDALVAETLAKPGAAGLSVAVARGERVVLEKGYGRIDLENDVPATASSVFRIASVTKQFTAAAILRLAERGKLALDDDITKHVDFPTHGRKITIRHLLQHTSGIPSYTDVPGFFDTGIARDVAPAEVLANVRELPLEFEPGSRWQYSNSGYHLLGMILEKRAGAPYAQHLQSDLFTPFGLARTRYDVAADVIPGRARGYGVVDGAPANASHISMTVPYASGGLLSTAGDLVRWQRAWIGGKVLGAESFAQMTAPAKLTDGSTASYGFGVFLSEVDGHRNFMHEGGIPGFNSILVGFPEEELAIAVLSNSSAVSSGALAAEIARAVFRLDEAR